MCASYIFVVDEHFRGIHLRVEPVHRRPPRRPTPNVVEDLLPRTRRCGLTHALGVTGKRAQHDSGSGVETPLPDYQMCCQVTIGPLPTQCRSIGGAEFDHAVHQGESFVMSEGHLRQSTRTGPGSSGSDLLCRIYGTAMTVGMIIGRRRYLSATQRPTTRRTDCAMR